MFHVPDNSAVSLVSGPSISSYPGSVYCDRLSFSSHGQGLSLHGENVYQDPGHVMGQGQMMSQGHHLGQQQMQQNQQRISLEHQMANMNLENNQHQVILPPGGHSVMSNYAQGFQNDGKAPAGLQQITEEKSVELSKVIDPDDPKWLESDPKKLASLADDGERLENSLKEDSHAEEYSADDPRWLVYDKTKLDEEYEKPTSRSYDQSIPYQLQVEHDRKHNEQDQQVRQQVQYQQPFQKPQCQQQQQWQQQPHIEQWHDDDKLHVDAAVPSSTVQNQTAYHENVPTPDRHIYENARPQHFKEEAHANKEPISMQSNLNLRTDDLDSSIPISGIPQATGPIYHNIEQGEVCLQKAPMKQDTEIIQNDANLIREINRPTFPDTQQPHLFVPVTTFSPEASADDKFEISNPDEEAFEFNQRAGGAHISLIRQQAVENTGPMATDLGLMSDDHHYDDNFPADDSCQVSGAYDSLEALRNKGLPAFMTFQEEESELEEINRLTTQQDNSDICAQASPSLLQDIQAVRLCDKFGLPGEHQHFQQIMQMSPQLYDQIQHDLSNQTKVQSGPPTPTRSTPSTPTYAQPIYSYYSQPS